MPFPLRLPRTLALGSRPRPGRGGALCCTGAPYLPEVQILWNRTMTLLPGILQHERVETIARLLQLELAMATDVTHRLQRERAPSSAAEIHEEFLGPDAYYRKYDGNEHILLLCILQRRTSMPGL